MTKHVNPVSRILKLVILERKEISQVYIYAVMYGIFMLAIPVGIQALVAFAQANIISASVILLVLLIVASVLISGLLQINQMKIIEKIQQRIFVRYAFGFAEKLPAINLSYTNNYYLPELVNRFFDTLTLQKKLAKLLLDFPLAIVQILFGLLLLAFYHPVFIAFGLLLALLVFGILYFSGMRGLTSSIEESNYKYKVVAWLQEMARIIRSIKFSRSRQFSLLKADKEITSYLVSRTAHFKVLLLQYKTLVGFKVMVTAAMLMVGTFLLINQQLTVGQFIASEIVILSILNSAEKLIVNLDSVYDVLTAVEKTEQVTDKESEPNGSIEYAADGKGMAVSMENFTVGYPGHPAILNRISFSVNANDKVWITGEAGSGKSTLLRSLGAFYHNYSGNLLINDIPLANYNIQSLRLNMGMMISQQDIFEGTLMENISMGLENVNNDELLKLCKITGLNDFIATLKNGFDTALNSDGRKLPANVVRKILLMRALISKPALLLLEEPLFGFDPECRQRIRQYLLYEMPGTTLFVITNDPAFGKLCNQVIHLEKQKK